MCVAVGRISDRRLRFCPTLRARCPVVHLLVLPLQTRNDVSNLTHIATTDRDLPRQRGTLVRVGGKTDETLETIVTMTVVVAATLIVIATAIEIEIETVAAGGTIMATVTHECAKVQGAEGLVPVHVPRRVRRQPTVSKALVLLRSTQRQTEQPASLPPHLLLKTKNSRLNAHVLKHGKKNRAQRKP
jgi:hypothetical protein